MVNCIPADVDMITIVSVGEMGNGGEATSRVEEVIWPDGITIV